VAHGPTSAIVYAFPTSRHREMVAFIASAMLSQPSPDAAEEYLIEHLEIEWGRLAGIGVGPTEIEWSCREFARAAWAIVMRRRKSEGVA
jgi:hypothetical protein